MNSSILLVAGREPELLSIIQSVVVDEAVEVHRVDKVNVAESTLREGTFDVVVVHDCAARLQDIDVASFVDSTGVRVPCIWITDEPTLDAALHAANEGVFSYLPEPVSQADFADHIRTARAQTQLERLAISAQERTMEMLKRQQHMREVTSNKDVLPNDVVVDAFFEMTFERIIDAYLDTRQLLHILSQKNPDALQQNLRQDPIKRRLVEAIKKGIDVLWGTRNQFKSKQLANLRKDFEGILQEVEAEQS